MIGGQDWHNAPVDPRSRLPILRALAIGVSPPLAKD
jgi:hypothetical protein